MRRFIYIITVLVIILGSWLLLNSRDNKSALEQEEKGVIRVNAANDYAAKSNIIVTNGHHSLQYLTPSYEFTVEKDITYASKQNETNAEEPLKLDLYQPTEDNNKQRPVFIYIHGGGYTGGSKNDTVEFSSALAKRGYVVITVDYRLKQDPFLNFTRTLTDAYEDINDVIKWVNTNSESYGLDAGSMAIGGDSAGGHLAMNFVNQYLPTNPTSFKSVFAIVDIYGGDLTRSAISELPPVLIIHGTIDTLVPYQQSVELAKQLKEKGVYHNFLTMNGVGHDYKNVKYIDEIIETTSHFLWNIMSNSDHTRLPENSGITIAAGDTFKIKLPEAYRSLLEDRINIDLPEGWLFMSEEEGILQIKSQEGLERGNNTLFFSRGNDPKGAISFTVNVSVIDPLAVHYETFFDVASKEIRTHMDVTNQSNNAFSGSVEAKYETVRSTQGIYSSSIENLEPGKRIRLEIPELAKGQRIFEATNDIGTTLQTTADSFNALLLPKLTQSVYIDGNLSDWRKQAQFDVKDVKINDWRGEQDISATGVLAWDADNLYLGVKVMDDKHEQSASVDAIWSGDSIQIGIGIADSDGSDPSEYHEIGVALGNGGALNKWRWIAPRGFSLGDAITLDYAVYRAGLTTSYELAIPWHELSYDSTQVKQGMKIKFSLLVNDNDEEGRRGWLEYNSGIGSSKDVNAFGDLFLVD